MSPIKYTAYLGIDYSLGMSNRDNFAHFGVISSHSIMPEAYADLEPIYPEITEAEDEFDCYDGLEPIGLEYDKEGYKIIDCLDSDLMIIKSPYYTYAQYCSPCVPGAGNLDNPMHKNAGIKTYCLGLDWFDEDSPCPYPVYSVETGKRIYK